MLAPPRKMDEGILAGGFMSMNIPGIVLDVTARHPIPTMFNGPFWVELGGLASYGADFHESGRQAARLVDKIIKGEKPATIPVESNSRIEFVINLKVARALGIVVPSAVVQRATRIIE
jgi:putative tryptophan/tyrosine transport system substrate-binding protein